jgi:hypothetical protein
MISGLVSPKSIGLINREHINQLLNKSKLMFKVSKFLTFGASFACFWSSGIPLIINFTPSLYWIEFFWTLHFTVFGYTPLILICLK